MVAGIFILKALWWLAVFSLKAFAVLVTGIGFCIYLAVSSQNEQYQWYAEPAGRLFRGDGRIHLRNKSYEVDKATWDEVINLTRRSRVRGVKAWEVERVLRNHGFCS